MPAKHDGRSLYVAFERNSRRKSGRFSLEQHMADIILFIASIDPGFFVNISRALFSISWRILRNFCRLAAEKMACE